MRRRFGLGVAAGVLAVGLLVVPVVPAGAETYQVSCAGGGIGTGSQTVYEVTGEGPSEPVVAGEPFVLSDVVVELVNPSITSGLVQLTREQWEEGMVPATLTLFGQQVVFSSVVVEGPEGAETFTSARPVWGPMDVELIAPDDVVGEVGIVPERLSHPDPLHLVDPTRVCTGFDADRPFAFVEVLAVPEPPGDGNGPGGAPGANGDDDGDDDGGDGPGRVVRQEVRRVQVPEAAHAAPSFTG